MKSLRNLADHPAAAPLLSDNILELHAARLILLISICGKGSHIDGLTKLAKLDFFVRYPAFFAEITRRLNKGDLGTLQPQSIAVESAMVRHHYGPWDKRYYHVLAFLEGAGILQVEPHGKGYRFLLTELGKARAAMLSSSEAFASLCDHMKQVCDLLGKKTGSTLKTLIYQAFEEEVARKPLGRIIEP